ncbi:MAG: cation:proton antiporter regulatory subunit [Chloroflexota bacterium]
MSDIHETQLPGVGIRHDFETEGGDRLGVILHHTGRRDLLVYDAEDPDSCASVVRLSEHDTHNLGHILGLDQTITTDQDRLLQNIGGLTIDWVPIRHGWKCGGRSLADLDIYSKTGAFVVAVVRSDEVIPSPPADFALLAGDTAVVVGKPESIEATFNLMQGD